MTFIQSLSSVFRNYANPKGRAPRSEFWWWQLFVFILALVAMILDEFLGLEINIFSSIISIGLLCPNICVYIRRCHDCGRTAWWILCPIGNIVIPLLPSVSEELPEKPSKKGCLTTFILTILALVAMVIAIVTAVGKEETPIDLTIDEVEYSTIEQIRELSGMKFLKEANFVRATRKYGSTYVTLEWKQSLTNSDKQKIVKYAKKSRYPQLWEFPTSSDQEEIVLQKIFSKDKDLVCYITYNMNSLTMEYGAPYILHEVEQILEGITIPSYTLVWYIYHNGLADDSMNAILQLHTSYVKFQKELERNGYVVEENDNNKIILAAHEFDSSGNIQVRTSVEINKKNNVVELNWGTY